MKDFWNERYSNSEYVYGREPNQFFRQVIDRLSPAKLLLPGEGEGRNAVYAAKEGWDVYAFDYSEEARNKALALAGENDIELEYELTSAEEASLPTGVFDAAAIIFVHLPKNNFESLLQKVISSLRSGGSLIMEVYSEKQLGRETGGPKSKEMLYRPDEIRSWLSKLKLELLEENVIDLHEGKHHTGEAVVIQAIGVKP